MAQQEFESVLSQARLNLFGKIILNPVALNGLAAITRSRAKYQKQP